MPWGPAKRAVQTVACGGWGIRLLCVSENLPVPAAPKGQFLLFNEGGANLRVRIDGQTVWLTQLQMAELYQTSVPNINQHLRGIYEEGELDAERTIKHYLIVRMEGHRQVRREVTTSMNCCNASGIRFGREHLHDGSVLNAAGVQTSIASVA